jgi:glutathione S-transferase
MSETIRIHSFADFDRSGKVRWTALELGLGVEEVRMQPGEHMSDAYRALNPWTMVPTAETGDEVLIESTAICLSLAERHPAGGLIPQADRAAFWQYVALATTSLETPVVSCVLVKMGIFDARWSELLEPGLRPRLVTLAERLPEKAFLCDSFTLADIFVAFVLRIAVQAELLPYEGRLAAYLDRLRARPAAQQAHFFDALDG